MDEETKQRLMSIGKKKAIVAYLMDVLEYLDGRGLVIEDYESIRNELENNFGTYQVLERIIRTDYDDNRKDN